MLRNGLFWIAGLVFLGLAKLKHTAQGYATPRPFPVERLEEAIGYDEAVINGWLKFLEKYTGAGGGLKEKHVLELGPGADLGVGLFLLQKGARSYAAFDKHPLARAAPDAFYERLFSYLAQGSSEPDIDELRGDLQRAKADSAGRLRYVHRGDFCLRRAFEPDSFDLIFSQAAFEHFDDVAGTFEDLSVVARPGARLVAEVDLQTHSRWVREMDPNNIYRYEVELYRLFRFDGMPNRIRPYEYVAALERSGWHRVRVLPLTKLTEEDVQRHRPYLARKFRRPEAQMDILSCMLLATYSSAAP